MYKHNEVTLQLTLTEEQWAEVVAAIDSKESDVKSGLYGSPSRAWARALKRVRTAVLAACREGGVIV